MKSIHRHLISATTFVCMTAALTSAQAQAFTPAVIFDMGGKHDKSFNQSAFDGAERFKKDFNVAYLEAEVTADSQREQIFRLWGIRLVLHQMNDADAVSDFFGKNCCGSIP